MEFDHAKYRGSLALLLVLLFVPVFPFASEKDAAEEGALPFMVVSRQHRFEFVPCNDCHDGEDVRPEVLELMTELHGVVVIHGEAELQCAQCHRLDREGSLHTLGGEPVDMDQAYIVCAQCHGGVYRDWKYGAHGKRLHRWRGGREVLNCTACHDPHNDTGAEPRAPMGPPGMRERMRREGHQLQAGTDTE
jgi:hypothetical protein